MKNRNIIIALSISTVVFAITTTVFGIKAFSKTKEANLNLKDYETTVFQVEYTTLDLQRNVGTCFAVEEGGYLMTNFHVFDNLNFQIGASVTLKDRDLNSFLGKVISYNNELDIAVIKSEELKNARPIEFADSLPKVGEKCFQLGNPYDKGITLSGGIISDPSVSINRNGNIQQFIESETKTYPGCSGGCLLNSSGKCIGMTSFRGISSNGDEIEDFGYAIPSSVLINAKRDLIL